MQPSKAWIAHTYFRLPPTVSLKEVRKVLDEFTESASPKQTGASGMRIRLAVTPIAAIHLQPKAAGSLKPRGNPTAIAAIAAVGALILLVAVVNFVNLATARASVRAVEIGVRKSVGASRLALLTQFTVEATVCTALAGLLSFAIVELCIPKFDGMVQATLETSDVYQPIVIAGSVGLLICVALLSGGYPAFVLSSIGPAVGLRGRSSYSGGGWVRRVLVSLQFAILTGLLIGAVALFAQTSFARKVENALSLADIYTIPGGCKTRGADAFQGLSGVVGAACSLSAPLGYVQISSMREVRAGVHTMFSKEPVDYGYFELYQVKPIAGRLFDRNHPPDAVVQSPAGVSSGAVVLSESAVRRFQFATPEEAIGKTISVFGKPGTAADARIIGVVPDLPQQSLRDRSDASVFYVAPQSFDLLSVKVRAAERASALANVDHLWQQLNASPINRFPVTMAFDGLYAEFESDNAVFTVSVGIACILACAGLYGLAAFTTNRRRKEVGIRKTLGADNRHIFQMFLWHLTVPVLWAQLLAWPICYWLLLRWLKGFTTHIPFPVSAFVLATGAVLAITWITTGLHAWWAATRRPVETLRYE
jgi:putative ABC transport system permease protein